MSSPAAFISYFSHRKVGAESLLSRWQTLICCAATIFCPRSPVTNFVFQYALPKFVLPAIPEQHVR